jgi:hypothetical protein
MTGYRTEAEVKSRIAAIAANIALCVIVLAALAALVFIFLPTNDKPRAVSALVSEFWVQGRS